MNNNNHTPKIIYRVTRSESQYGQYEHLEIEVGDSNLLNEETDMAWLHSCAYFHRASNKRFEFLCTSENKNRV